MKAIDPGRLAEVDQDVKDDQEMLLDLAGHFREHMARRGHTSAMRCLMADVRRYDREDRTGYLLVAAVTLIAGRNEEAELEALLSETPLVEIGDTE